MAGRVIISFQGSKNTCSQLRDSGRRCGSFCASFCLGKEILTGERQTCFILHYPLPPHTVHFLPYPCAQMWHKAFSLQQSPYSISAVFPQSSTQHCSSHFDLCIPLFFFFLASHCTVSFWHRQALLSKSGTHADTLCASRGSLISLIKYARTHFKNMNPRTDKHKIY